MRWMCGKDKRNIVDKKDGNVLLELLTVHVSVFWPYFIELAWTQQRKAVTQTASYSSSFAAFNRNQAAFLLEWRSKHLVKNVS
jgi:hypothetical protein